MKLLKTLSICLLVSLLLAQCSNPKKENDNTKNNPDDSHEFLFRAALDGDLNTIKSAVRNEWDINQVNGEGHTMLMFACFNGHFNTAKYLLQEGAFVNKKDLNGRTALMFASSGKNSKTVQLLINAGAKINEIDKKEKFTALMFAASEGNMEVVRMLINEGADIKLKDADGETAYDFALRNGHQETASLLKQ